MSEIASLKIEISGEVAAEALRIAERRLIRLGWTHSPEDIGSCARKILTAYAKDQPA